MNTVSVSLENRSYDIKIGADLLPKLHSLVHEVAPATSYFFVLDDGIGSSHGRTAMQSFDEESMMCTIEASESNKTIDSIQKIWTEMLAHGCDRQCSLVAIGGGLIGDVGGFAAATFMRGISLIQVPTTLLAMVDASIGGKTGINLPLQRGEESSVLGKNLAGSFWQPRLVVADVTTLLSLNERQFRCGLAECVKHSMLGHDALLDYMMQHIEEIFDRASTTMIELVTMNAEIKAGIVAEDEREAGKRVLLNLGHTFAHAIEPLPELSLYHGEAVAIGLCAAVTCAEAMGLADAEVVDRTRDMLIKLGLPTRLPVPVGIEELCNLMRSDKKTIDSQLRLVLPTKDGAMLVENVDSSAVGLAWASVGAFA